MAQTTRWIKDGSRLLNQQCRLWGRDICRPEGNVLLERGFHRHRATDGSNASSQYTLQTAPDRLIRLWGFGLYYGGCGEHGSGIFINRFEFEPRLASAAADRWHSAAELQHLPRASDEESNLLREALSWIAGYERWVRLTYGVPYRQLCLIEARSRWSAPHRLPEAWEDLRARMTAASRAPATATQAHAAC